MQIELKALGLPKQLDLAQLSEALNTNFLYEKERGMLYLKRDTNVYCSVPDFEIYLSRLGIRTAGRESLKTALESSSLETRNWLYHRLVTLPKWDGVDRIEQLSSYFAFSNDEQKKIHSKVFRYWIVKAAEMVAYPNDINAVNRLVITYQSKKQGIGKTTFARWLAEPFAVGSKASIKELDRPVFDKDANIELGKNIICLLDDIDSWNATGLRNCKSVISSKTINARIPYARESSYIQRTASFIATTNEEGFLNESGNTRWAIFNLDSIDFEYSKIDQEQLWAQARDLVISKTNIYDKEVREYCLKSSEQHNITTELDEIVAHWFEFDPKGGRRATELFDQIPVQEQQFFGYGASRLGKFTKSIKRVFATYGENIKYGSSGRNKWRLKISTEHMIE